MDVVLATAICTTAIILGFPFVLWLLMRSPARSADPTADMSTERQRLMRNVLTYNAKNTPATAQLKNDALTFKDWGNPRDWTYQWGSPTGTRDVVLYEVPLGVKMRAIQIRDKQRYPELLFSAPFKEDDDVDRNRALDLCVQEARMKQWKIIPFAISSFVGGLY